MTSRTAGERTVNVLEVRLTSADPDATGDPDQLALDDRAWAIVPPTRERVILVVGEGDPYLETALSKLPNVDLWLGTPADYARNPDNPEGKPWDLVIFEGTVPSELPDVPILAIAPDRSSPLGSVNGTLPNPGIGSLNPDEPILSFVDLSTLHVAEAARMTLPDWARAVIPGPRGAPLLYAGERDGLPTAVLAFDPRQSDLPLQVAFPILLANLTGELLGGSSTPVDPIRPGDPVELTIRPGTAALRITAPDGAVQELVPGTDGSSSVTYSATGLPGVYTVTPILDPAASPAPSGSTPRPTVRPESSPSASGAPAAAGDDTLHHQLVRRGAVRRPRIHDHAGRRARPRGARRRDGRRTGRVPGHGGRSGRGRGPADHARRAVDPDRAARPHRAVRRVGRLSPRRSWPASGAGSRRGSVARPAGAPRWASRSKRRSRSCCSSRRSS